MSTTLVLAGVYNLVWGIVVVCFPMAAFQLTGLAEPLYPSIWQCVGMIVGVYGIGYLIAATDPTRHWPIVLVGLLGKVFGPIGFIWAAVRGELPWMFGLTLVTNDLIWWVPFILILKQAWFPQTEGTRVQLADAIQEAKTNSGASLDALSRSQPVLVIFMRHSGCTFCRQTMATIADHRAEIEESGYGIVIVHMSSDSQAAAWLSRYGLDDLPRISDPTRELYEAFELKRGSIRQLFGPAVWLAGFKALRQGHGIGELDGDGFQLAGAFAISRGQVIGTQRAVHAADQPDLDALMSCGLPT